MSTGVGCPQVRPDVLFFFFFFRFEKTSLQLRGLNFLFEALGPFLQEAGAFAAWIRTGVNALKEVDLILPNTPLATQRRPWEITEE